MGVARCSDLLKMHAYRDAIYRSSGAYVVYPGEEDAEDQHWQEYREILPGLGAFRLRPTENGGNGEPEGLGALTDFVDDVLGHVANQVSEHERASYWVRESFAEEKIPEEAPAASFLEQPPADTVVLLGWVKNPAQLTWIHRQQLYNLRADENRDGRVGLDSDELAADLLLLYGNQINGTELWSITDEPRVLTRGQLLDRNYPNPGGERYFSLTLGRELTGQWPGTIEFEEVWQLWRQCCDGPKGTPLAVRWADVVEVIQP